MHRTAVLSALLLLASMTAPVPAQAQAGGPLLIVGGGRQPDELVTRFIELAGGRGARIAVVPMASASAREAGEEKVRQLVELGARVFNLHLTREEALTDSAAALLDGVTGVWFNGGDQARLVAVLQGTPVLAAIRERHAAGAVIGGTSAGAAIMSDSMLTGGQRRTARDTAGYYGDEYRRIARAAIEVVPGFGFLRGVIVDQHFIERERHNRLLSVVLERPALLGAGIAEGTAIEVRPDGEWRVLGRGAVVVYDARRAGITDPAAPVLGATDVRMHVLPAGARFDPVTGTALLQPAAP